MPIGNKLIGAEGCETPTGIARVRRSTWEHKYSIPKLAEAVPVESEHPGAKINSRLTSHNSKKKQKTLLLLELPKN